MAKGGGLGTVCLYSFLCDWRVCGEFRDGLRGAFPSGRFLAAQHQGGILRLGFTYRPSGLAGQVDARGAEDQAL